MATYQKVVSESSSGTISQNTSGNSATATALATAQNFSISGDITASAVSFDGSGAVALSASIDNGTVDGNALASNAVTNVKITDNTISEAKLSIANSAQDGYVLSWDNSESDMKWVAQSIDLANLPDMTQSWSNSADEFIVLDAGTQKRKLSSEIFGSNAFNSTTIPTNNNQLTNGAGYTTNTGTVTSVGTGTGLSGTITSSGSITLNFGALGTVTSWQAGGAGNDIDSIIVYDDSESGAKQAFYQDIPVSFFQNDASYTSNIGDITAVTVTAGNGLTGGGSASSGAFSKSLAVGAGTGVTVNSNDVAIGQDVATTADVDFATVTTSGNMTVGGDLTVSGATITTSTETLEIADNTLILNSDLTGTAVDAGFIVERGSTGDNACLWYDTSEGAWVVGTNSATSLPSSGTRIALQSVKATLDTTDTTVPVGGMQIAGGVAYVRTA